MSAQLRIATVCVQHGHSESHTGGREEERRGEERSGNVCCERFLRSLVIEKIYIFVPFLCSRVELFCGLVQGVFAGMQQSSVRLSEPPRLATTEGQHNVTVY